MWGMDTIRDGAGRAPFRATARVISLLLASAVLIGCTYVPIDRTSERNLSVSSSGRITPANSYRERNRVALQTAEVLPLADGEAALAQRLELVDQAQEKLDISAFIIRPDHAGFLFMERLVRAADRGVKIRLLLDDLFNRRTSGRFVAVDHHPNIDVRLYNPFSRFSPTVVGYALDYSRVSRRKHSRVIIADGSKAILGGRNVADEYYSHDGSSAFMDFELFVEGRIVETFGPVFDEFWYDPWSVPVQRFGNVDYAGVFKRLRPALAERAREAQPKYASIVTPDLDLQRVTARAPRFSARSGFVSDVPDKLRDHQASLPINVAGHHLATLRNAKRNVMIVTPYFIPQERGALLMEELVDRGVAVTVVTNSLASTNHVSVHGGYLEYRARLLKAGVEIYELMPDGTVDKEVPDIRNTLHTKLTVIDGQETIVTSMNFDPVSMRGNAESSIIVMDREFGKWVLRNTAELTKSQSFRLSLSDEGRVVWSHTRPGMPPVEITEPGAGALRRITANLVRIMGLGDML